jgi:hypothetical protein
VILIVNRVKAFCIRVHAEALPCCVQMTGKPEVIESSLPVGRRSARSCSLAA